MHFPLPAFAATLLLIPLPTSYALPQPIAETKRKVYGDIYNGTPFRMAWADFDQDKDGNTHKCRVYNWSDSPFFTPATPNSQLKNCFQTSLEPWTHEGGASRKVDVDGFSFPYREFQVRWVNAPGCVGAMCASDTVFDLQAGVWVKFAGYNSATCQEKSWRPDGKPVCYIH